MSYFSNSQNRLLMLVALCVFAGSALVVNKLSPSRCPEFKVIYGQAFQHTRTADEMADALDKIVSACGTHDPELTPEGIKAARMMVTLKRSFEAGRMPTNAKIGERPTSAEMEAWFK